MNRNVLLVTLLVFSIGLNLLFIGVAMGRHLLGLSPGRAHFEWMTQEVSNETREKLRSTRRAYMQESRPALRELRKAQHQFRAAVSTDEYVETEVVARLTEVRRASADLQKSMHRQMVEILRELAPEERSQVLDMIKFQINGRWDGPTSEDHGKPGDAPQGSNLGSQSSCSDRKSLC